MRLGVLGAADSWYVRDLARAAAGEHEILPLPFTGLHGGIGIEPTRTTVRSQSADLLNLDALLVRAMPPGSLEQVVFRMDLLGVCHSTGTVVVNPPRAIEVAVDKYLALARLQQQGLPVPPTIVCQGADEALQAFHQLGRDVVIKPLFGAEGRGITRITDEPLAERAFRTLEQLQAVIYVQKFIEHANTDLRLLVIGQQILAMQRTNPNDWRTNACRGATCQATELSEPLAQLALQSAAAIGASLAGIDVVRDQSGRPYVLEVNAAPGWKALARAHELDVSRLVLKHLAELVNARPSSSH